MLRQPPTGGGVGLGSRPPRGSGKAKAKLLPPGPLASLVPAAPRRLREKSPLPGTDGRLHPGTDATSLKAILPGSSLEGKWKEFYGSGTVRFFLEVVGEAQGEGGRIFPCRLVAGSTLDIRE